jgi:hypothetical protein
LAKSNNKKAPPVASLPSEITLSQDSGKHEETPIKMEYSKCGNYHWETHPYLSGRIKVWHRTLPRKVMQYSSSSEDSSYEDDESHVVKKLKFGSPGRNMSKQDEQMEKDLAKLLGDDYIPLKTRPRQVKTPDEVDLSALDSSSSSDDTSVHPPARTRPIQVKTLDEVDLSALDSSSSSDDTLVQRL